MIKQFDEKRRKAIQELQRLALFVEGIFMKDKKPEVKKEPEEFSEYAEAVAAKLKEKKK